MIDQVLAYIRRDLRDRLGLADDEVILEGASGASGRSPAGVRLTLVNLEQAEPERGRPPVGPRPGIGAGGGPALNLYLLIAFEFQDYETSLRHLSAALDVLHDTPLHTAAGAGADNPFPAGLETLSVALHGMSFESLQRLWDLLGRPYAPSAVYRLGLRRAAAGEGGQ